MRFEDHPARVKCNNPKMYWWRNWERKSPFAPSFDIPVYLDNYDTAFSTELAMVIDRKECQWDYKRFNWLSYNIFDWDNEVIARGVTNSAPLLVRIVFIITLLFFRSLMISRLL